MKVPEIRQFDSLDALIQIFQEPGEFAKQLRLLRDAEKALNEKYKLAGTLSEGEAFLADAAAKLQEARDVRRQADEYLAEAHKQAGVIVAAAEAEATQRRVEAEDAHARAVAQLEEAKGAKAQAAAVAQQGREALERAQTLKNEAEQQMRDALAIRSEFEDRMAKLKALSG